MDRRLHSAIIFLIMSSMILMGVYFYFHARAEFSSLEKKNFFSTQRKKAFLVKGFRFDGFDAGKKTLSIKAVKFHIEKKKIGIFKISPVRIAIFRDAKIDFFIYNSPSSAALIVKSEDALKEYFSQDTFLLSTIKSAQSIIFEPVKINFHFSNGSVTKIEARKATIDGRRKRIILKDEVLAKAGSDQLMTNRLMIYPEKGTIETKNKYVLITQGEETKGDKLTTDLYLKQLGLH